jgi:hypothetical protein
VTNSLHDLVVRPCSFRDACAFIAMHHRHHKPPQGHKWSLSVWNGHLCGVATVGRPTARRLDDGLTAEVTRLCTDGTDNACSCLYAAARRVAKEMGYAHIVTFILASEPGTSLRAAGWVKECDTPGASWNVPSRPRTDKHPIEPKQRWGAWLVPHNPELCGERAKASESKEEQSDD